MATIGLVVVALLTAQKTVVEIRTPAPFEWVGELAAGLFALLVGAIVYAALYVTVGDYTPPEIPHFDPFPSYRIGATV